MYIGAAIVESRQLLRMLNTDPVIPLLGIYPKEWEAGTQKLVHQRSLHAAVPSKLIGWNPKDGVSGAFGRR